METNFFKSLSKESAYWAGFIAADGFVHDEKNTISINLGHKDLDHLLKLESTLGLEHKVKRNKITNSYYLNVYGCEELKQDLANIYNITYKKTFTLQPPNIVDNSLIKSYICGYIDGDGCIAYENIGNKKRALRLTILGTKDLLNWIKRFIEQCLNLSTNEIEKLGKIYRYRISSKDALNVLNFLKDDDLPLLSRKWSFNPEVYYYSENKELEYKYKADTIKLSDFKTLMSELNIKKSLTVSSFDYYYVDKNNEDNFIRYRDSSDSPELTKKIKVKNKDNWERVEVDLPLDSNKVNLQIVEDFVELDNYKKNFIIYKTCHIYWLDDVNFVYYIVYDTEANEIGRFIEVEVNKNKVDGLGDKAFVLLKEYEQKLSILGLIPQNRLKRSLFEMYRR